MSGYNSNNSSSSGSGNRSAQIPLDQDGNPIIGGAISRMDFPPREPLRRESASADVSGLLGRLNPPPRSRSTQQERSVSAARPLSIHEGMLASAQNVPSGHRERRYQHESDEDDEDDTPRSGPRQRAVAPLNPGAPLSWTPGNHDLTRPMEDSGEVRAERRRAEQERAQAQRMAESAAGKLMRTMQNDIAEKKGKGGDGGET